MSASGNSVHAPVVEEDPFESLYLEDLSHLGRSIRGSPSLRGDGDDDDDDDGDVADDGDGDKDDRGNDLDLDILPPRVVTFHGDKGVVTVVLGADAASHAEDDHFYDGSNDHFPTGRHGTIRGSASVSSAVSSSESSRHADVDVSHHGGVSEPLMASVPVPLPHGENGRVISGGGIGGVGGGVGVGGLGMGIIGGCAVAPEEHRARAGSRIQRHRYQNLAAKRRRVSRENGGNENGDDDGGIDAASNNGNGNGNDDDGDESESECECESESEVDGHLDQGSFRASTRPVNNNNNNNASAASAPAASTAASTGKRRTGPSPSAVDVAQSRLRSAMLYCVSNGIFTNAAERAALADVRRDLGMETHGINGIDPSLSTLNGATMMMTLSSGVNLASLPIAGGSLTMRHIAGAEGRSVKFVHSAVASLRSFVASHLSRSPGHDSTSLPRITTAEALAALAPKRRGGVASVGWKVRPNHIRGLREFCERFAAGEQGQQTQVQSSSSSALASSSSNATSHASTTDVPGNFPFGAAGGPNAPRYPSVVRMRQWLLAEYPDIGSISMSQVSRIARELFKATQPATEKEDAS